MPGTPASARVGTSGVNGLRLAVVMASGTTLPSLMTGTIGRRLTRRSMPAQRSVTGCAAIRTWVISTPVFCLKASPPDGVTPTPGEP